jgi:hypothetical protein
MCVCVWRVYVYVRVYVRVWGITNDATSTNNINNIIILNNTMEFSFHSNSTKTFQMLIFSIVLFNKTLKF